MIGHENTRKYPKLLQMMAPYPAIILATLALAVIRPTCGAAPSFTDAMISTSSSCNAGADAKFCLVSGTINVDASSEVRVKALARGATAPAAWDDFQSNTETILATSTLPTSDPLYASFTGIDAEVDVYVAGKTGVDLTIVKVSGNCDCAPPTLSNVKLGSASCDASSKQKNCTVEFDLALNAGGMSPGKVYTITQLSSAAAPTSYDDFNAFKNAVPDPRTELKVETAGTGNTIRRTITNGQDGGDYSIYVVAKTSGGNISPITKLAACQCPTSIPSFSNLAVGVEPSCNPEQETKMCEVTGSITVGGSTMINVLAQAKGTAVPSSMENDAMGMENPITESGAVKGTNWGAYSNPIAQNVEVDLYIQATTGSVSSPIQKVAGTCACPVPPTLTNVKLGQATCDADGNKKCEILFDIALSTGQAAKVYAIVEPQSSVETNGAPKKYSDFNAHKGKSVDPRVSVEVKADAKGYAMTRTVTKGTKDAQMNIFVGAKTGGGLMGTIIKLDACECSNGTAPTPTPSTLSSGADDKETFPVWGVVLIIIAVMLVGLIPLCPVCLAMLKKKKKENEGGTNETNKGAAVVPTGAAP